MTITLLISTYNFPEALRYSMLSVPIQTRKPDEMIIADDGSREDTRAVIEDLRPQMPCPVKHVWHEDKGFRRTVILNRALAVSTGDYIVQIDGDIIMERHFIEDHEHYAEQGYFLCGSRSRVTKEYSERLFKGEPLHFSFLRPGLFDRINALRCRILTPFFTNYNHLRGCNMSYWRADVLATNGYDETIQSYGYEDEDLQNRLIRTGKKKRFIKFMCIEFHLYHEEHPTKKNLKETRKLIDKNNDEGLIWSPVGIAEKIEEGA